MSDQEILRSIEQQLHDLKERWARTQPDTLFDCGYLDAARALVDEYVDLSDEERRERDEARSADRLLWALDAARGDQ